MDKVNQNFRKRKDIDNELKELTDEIKSSNNKIKETKEEEILYRLIYLYKLKNDFQKEKNYIELCIKKDIILSEEIWLDYINISKKEKDFGDNDIINIYLKALDNFIYPKIIYDFFQYLLNCDKINENNNYDFYFNKFLILGLFSPEYSIQIFDLYYLFNKKIYENNKKELKDFSKYIKNKLNNEYFLSESEIEQILIKYKQNIGKKEDIFFILNSNDSIDNDENTNKNIIMKITEFNSQYNILFNESFENIDLIMEHLESNLNLLLKVNEKYIILL